MIWTDEHSNRTSESETNLHVSGIVRRVLPLASDDLEVLQQASARGWLEVAPFVEDGVLRRWRRECERQRKPVAFSRPERTRTSIWITLPEGQSWSQRQRELITKSKTSTSSVFCGENSLRAFVPPGAEPGFFSGLLCNG